MPERRPVPAQRDPARRRAGDAARALLRPRLRPRLHPVHGADGAPPDLVGARPGPARARHALVGVDRLRLADQRHRPRGGRRAPGHVRRDGGAADRLALRAGGVRRASPSSSRSPTAPCGSPTSASSCSPAPRTTPCATRCSGSAVSTAIAVGLLAIASLFDGLAQGAIWLLALLLDMGGPYLFGAEGWKLVPEHFAERHGLIVIIALGESIVAIGVGAAGAPHLRDRRRRGARRRPDRGDVVDLLRRRRDRLRAAAGRRRAGPGAERDGPRLLLLHAPDDGRRDRSSSPSA